MALVAKIIEMLLHINAHYCLSHQIDLFCAKKINISILNNIESMFYDKKFKSRNNVIIKMVLSTSADY